MKKIILLFTLFLLPICVKASTLPRIDKLTVEGIEVELKENIFTYEVTTTRDGYKADIDIELSDGLTYTIEGDTGLTLGTNPIQISVKNEVGEEQIYTINLLKASDDSVVLSGNNYLSSLTVRGYSLNFDPEVTEYHLKIGTERKLDIRYDTQSSKAVVNISGNFALVDGSEIVLSVIAQSGAIRKYTIYIESEYVPEKEDIYYRDPIDWKMVTLLGVAGVLAVGLIVLNVSGNKKGKRKKKEK